VGLGGRLAAADTERVRLTVRTAEVVEGRVADVGQDWVLVEGRPRWALVPFDGVVAVVGLGPRAEPGGARRRFGLGYALRGLSRDRAVVTVHDVVGAAHTGTIDAVGRDVLELAEHAADLPRRPEHVTARRVVPFAAVVLVRPA
jgi:hypothetical protein